MTMLSGPSVVSSSGGAPAAAPRVLSVSGEQQVQHGARLLKVQLDAYRLLVACMAHGCVEYRGTARESARSGAS